MRLRHPYALDDDAPSPDGAVHWGGRREMSEVDADGTFYVPDGEAENFVNRWPEADGYTLADLRVSDESGASAEGSDDTGDGSNEADAADTCSATVERTGEVCGRDLPCPYHSED